MFLRSGCPLWMTLPVLWPAIRTVCLRRYLWPPASAKAVDSGPSDLHSEERTTATGVAKNYRVHRFCIPLQLWLQKGRRFLLSLSPKHTTTTAESCADRRIGKYTSIFTSPRQRAKLYSLLRRVQDMWKLRELLLKYELLMAEALWHVCLSLTRGFTSGTDNTHCSFTCLNHKVSKGCF